MTTTDFPADTSKKSETPDEAITRELYEEYGITSSDLKRSDFFMHSDGKLILAYVGIANTNTMSSPKNELEGIPQWLTRNEPERIDIESSYRRLALENW